MNPAAGKRPNVVVIGGGISGLSAAWELTSSKVATITVLDAAPRTGGKLASTSIGGIEVDSGPDAFLARASAAVNLCSQIGIAGELVGPMTSSAYIWTRGKLRRMPEGLVLGFPSRMTSVARSGILPPHAIVRALADLALPRTHFAEDVSVADLVSSRLGRGATERLIEPLLGGIHAGTADGLSLSEVAPQLARVMLGAAVGEGEFNDPNSLNKIEWRPSRSVILAARKLRAAYPQSSGSKSPIFLAPRGGVHRITSTLTEALRKRGTEIVTSAPVDSLQITDSGFKIQLRNGVTLSADSVIVATPAHVSARLLTSVSPELSRELLQIRYASVAVVTLLYPEGTIPREMNGTGFLSPRFERRLMTAATWLSSKWEHYLPDNGCLVRISVGRIGDERFANMSDADLSASVQSEFSEAMATLGIGIGQKIPQYSVTRWPLAIPQYEVGHRERIVKIRSLANLQGLFLAGAYLDGVGIPACIEVGVAAAKQSSQYICKR